MNDRKTLLDLKYFPIVLTRNGWNVFATKFHSREFEALELSKIGRCEREAAQKLLQDCRKNSRVDIMENTNLSKWIYPPVFVLSSI